MYNAHNRLPLILFFFCVLVGVNLCQIASAKITGNALFACDMIKEDGKWSREFEQNINLDARGRIGLKNLLGLNFGVVRRGKEWTLAGGIPTYALSLQGKKYNLSSGYSVRMYRDIISSRLYENLSVSLPNLPTFRLAYAEQGTKDTEREHKTNFTGSNIQLGVEDEIGPFRITLNRREYSSRDLVRGGKYDTKSANTSGNVDFTYFYRQLFFLGGQYGMGRLRTERRTTEEIKRRTRDFSLDFRISPVSTIALSGTTVGRQEKRNGQTIDLSSDSLTNRFQLMLQPVEGIHLNAIYSKNDTSRDEERLFSNETKSLLLNVEPWQNLVFFGNFMVYDSQGREKRLSTLRRNSFDLRAEPIEGLRISSRLDLSESTDFVSGFRNDRNNITTKLEAIPTGNLRADISYDWLKFSSILRDAINEEVRRRVAFAVNYYFARTLNFNFRSSKDIFGKWEDSATFLTCGLNYLRDSSYLNLRYNRVSRPGRNTLSLRENKWITRTLTVEFGQKIGRDTNLRLSYESRREMKRISFFVNIRF